MDIKIVALRFFIALICGAALGLEREISDKAAGLRTHILVCLGSCLAGIMGMVIYQSGLGTDVLRIAQGVLMGIGFLGAGVIFKEGQSVKGLTTAAGIWVMGAIGLSIGFGLYKIALVGTLFSIITVMFFRRLEGIVKK